MVTEPSVDEELVPKNEDENGNQEILMDQVFQNDDEEYDDCDNHDCYDLEKEEKEEEKGEEMREKLMEKKKVLPKKNEDDIWNQDIPMDEINPGKDS